MSTLWSGVAIGSVYAFVALTMNVTLASTGIFNFAQAQIVMVGTFVAYVTLGEYNWPVVAVVLFCAAIGGAIGFLEERVAIRPLSDSRGLGYLVTTVGFAVALEGAVYVIYGTNPRNLNFFGGSGSFNLLGGEVLPVGATLFLVVAVMALVLHVATKRTRFGLMSRAATSDSDAAAIRGVNVRRISLLAFSVAGALGAAGGVLIAPVAGVSYNLGDTLVVFGFMVLAVGGFGSYGGALLGGIVIGIIQEEAERYLPLGYPLVILFAILLLVLFLKPTGVFGRRNLRVI